MLVEAIAQMILNDKILRLYSFGCQWKTTYAVRAGKVKICLSDKKTVLDFLKKVYGYFCKRERCMHDTSNTTWLSRPHSI